MDWRESKATASKVSLVWPVGRRSCQNMEPILATTADKATELEVRLSSCFLGCLLYHFGSR